MDLKSLYRAIIENARKREKEHPLDPEFVCIERHHVKPKCLGGSASKRNIVQLTGREHFICHWLLYRIYKHEKLACAFAMMARSSGNQERRITSKEYEYIRLALSKSKQGKALYVNKDTGEYKWLRKTSKEFKKGNWESFRVGKAVYKNLKTGKKKLFSASPDPKVWVIANSGKGNFFDTKLNKVVCVPKYEVILHPKRYQPMHKNKVLMRHKRTGDTVYVLKTDPIFQSPEYEPYQTGFACFVNKRTGERVMLHESDPRRNSKDWQSVSTGFGTYRNKYTKETKYLSKNDPAVLDGTYIGTTTGKALFINKNTGERLLLSKNDKRRNNGEWEHFCKGKTRYRNVKTGEYRMLSKDDPLVISGKYVHATQGVAPYRSKRSGKVIMMTKDDPRRNNGKWEPACKGVNLGRKKYINTKTKEVKCMMPDNPLLKNKQWMQAKDYYEKFGTPPVYVS